MSSSASPEPMSTDEILAMAGTGFDLDNDELEGHHADEPTARWVTHLRGIRATGDEFRMAIWYPFWVATLWCSLAGVSLGIGFLCASNDAGQASVFALGSGLICVFVASFVARPLVVVDRTGIELRPSFSSRSAFRWSEITSLGLDTVRRGRTRGAAFVVRGAEDREVAVDGAWLGLTAPQLHRLDVTVRRFARSIGVTGPAVEEGVVLTEDEDARYH